MTEVGARRGYAACSVEEVIVAAGVARSTFYAHFRDRDDCFLAALELLADRAAAAVASSADGGRGAAGAVALVEFARRDPAGAQVLFVESLAAGERGFEPRQRLIAKVEEGLGTNQVAGLTGGVLRLLAMRLSRSDPDLAGLGDDLAAWIGSYASACSRSVPPAAAVAAVARQRLSPAELVGAQRTRIFRATAGESYERGYSAVRVADITAAAKVSRRTFYSLFASKAEAATEANERLFQAALSACAGSFFGSDSWPDRVWAGGSVLLAFLTAHPREAYLGFVEPHAIGPEATKHVYDRLQAFTLFLEEGYRQRPEAEALPHTVSDALAAAMFELAFQHLRERGSLDQLPQSLPLLVYTILAPFMGAEAASDFIATKTD